MSPSTEQVFRTALTLPAEDRFELIEALIAASDPVDSPPFDESWRAVIQRRSSEIDTGVIQLTPWDDVQRQARQRVGLDG